MYVQFLEQCLAYGIPNKSSVNIDDGDDVSLMLPRALGTFLYRKRLS